MACIKKRRGRWVIDFYDQHGKRRWKTLPEKTTKKKAREELRAIEEQVGRRTFIPIKEIPVFKAVAKEFIEAKQPNLRANTFEVYEGIVKNHFHYSDEEAHKGVSLDPMKITRITTATVEKYIRARQEEGWNIATLRKSLMVMGQIFNYAVRHRYIDFNPLREAERPRVRGHEGENEQKEMKVLTPFQIKALLDKTKEQKYKVLFTLAAFTGMRQGEILGLKWEDIDWEAKQVHVQRTFNNGRFFETKTKGSNRRIDLAPTVIIDLKKWKLASGRNDLGLVFCNEAGNPIEHHNLVNRHFIPALIKAGIAKKLENGAIEGKVRFHDLRHSYASILIEQGENLKYIQSQLGHSSPTVTLNVYAHLMKPANQEAACRLEKTIFGDGSKMVAEAEGKAENA
jgi:integrase